MSIGRITPKSDLLRLLDAGNTSYEKLRVFFERYSPRHWIQNNNK